MAAFLMAVAGLFVGGAWSNLRHEERTTGRVVVGVGCLLLAALALAGAVTRL